MNDRGIFILPQTPIESLNYSKYIPLIISDILSKIIGAKNHCCINILDSYNERYVLLDKYIENINKKGISYDDIWIDKEHIDSLISNIYKLISLGYIDEIYTNTYVCDCGRVEIEENKLSSCNLNNLGFYYKDGQMYCKYCHSKCRQEFAKVLTFIPKNVSRESLNFLPKFLNKDSKTYENTVINSYVTISRKRDTGIKLQYNGTNYNIDIDFLWFTYLACFSEMEKIVISGNKMMYQLFMVGILEKILVPESNTILMGIPIVENVNTYLNESIDSKVAILSLIFNMRWNKKNIEFDNGILRKLYRTGNDNLDILYNTVIESIDINDFYNDVNYILGDRFNYQKILKRVKDRR